MNENYFIGAEIKRVPYSRMLKSNVAGYADKVVSKIKVYDIESLLSNPVFNMLLDQESNIAKLRIIYGVDTNIKSIARLKSLRNLKISNFKLDVRMKSKLNAELDFHVIDNAIDNHLSYFNRCKNDDEVNQKISGFFDFVESNDELAANLEEHSLLEKVMVVSAAHDSVIGAMEQRVSLRSRRNRVTTDTVVKEVAASLDNIFKAIEFEYLAAIARERAGGNDDEGAMTTSSKKIGELINELNDLADIYRRSVYVREANNRRKAKMKESESDKSDESIDDTDMDDTLDELDEPTEEDASTEDDASEEEDAPVENGEEHDTTEVHVASMRMMDVPSGLTSSIELLGNSEEDESKEEFSDNGECVEQEKAVEDILGTSQQPFDNENE